MIENDSRSNGPSGRGLTEIPSLGGLGGPGGGDALRLTQKIDAWNKQISVEGWSIQIPSDFSGRSALEKGCKLFQNFGALVVGMSLGNSYFSPENISKLLFCL